MAGIDESAFLWDVSMHSGKDEKELPIDPETILFTLDQLGQTVEVMNKVITRLRGYVMQNIAAQHQGELDFDKPAVQSGKAGSSGLH